MLNLLHRGVHRATSSPIGRGTLALGAVLCLAACAQPTPGPSRQVNVTSPAPPTAQTESQPAVSDADATQQAAAEAVPTSEPAASAADNIAPGRWWERTPDPVAGRLRLVGVGSADSLLEARRLAVANARDLLARSLSEEPEEATVERTAAESADGVYTAWVLISAPSSP